MPEAEDWRRIEQLANQLRAVSVDGQTRQLTMKQKQFAFSLTQVRPRECVTSGQCDGHAKWLLQSISMCIPGLPETDDVAPLLMELKREPVVHHHHSPVLINKPAQLLPRSEQG